MSNVLIAPSTFGNVGQWMDRLAIGNPEGNPASVIGDFDEFGHAGFALFKGGGSAAFHEQAYHQAALATSGHHFSAQAFDPLARSAHGLVGLAAGSAAVAPLGLLAMRAGWVEGNEARENAKHFLERDMALVRESAFVKRESHVLRTDLAANFRAITTNARLRGSDNKVFMRANRYNGLVGAFSFLSGLAIVSRIAVELARNLGGAVAAGSTDVYAAAENKSIPSQFSGGTGLASNAFAILASGFAFALGVSFVRKSKAMNKAWHVAAPTLQNARAKHIAANSSYGKFIDKKSAYRRDFAHRFHVKNRMFLVGTALYAAGTMLPVCVKALAAAGVLSSKKIDANVILALFATGIAGAIMMGLFSHQFFFGHPTIGRHEEHRFKDPLELGRRFLTAIDTFVLPKDKGCSELAIKRGVAMRTAAFDQLQSNERTREDFLARIASGMNRKFIHVAHVGDDDYMNFRPLSTKVKARLNSGQLRKRDVASWAAEIANQSRIREFYKKITDTKISFLAQKESLMTEIHDYIMGGVKKAQLEAYNERQNISIITLGDRKAPAARLLSYRRISEQLGNEKLTAVDFESTLSEFLKLDDNPEVDEEEKPDTKSLAEKIAEHLMDTMPQNYNHHRGCLLEMENQAAKQRHAVADPKFHPLPLR